MSLNLRQQLFVQEYLKDPNATQAAIRAGYSPRTAHSCGPRLLENVGVKEGAKVYELIGKHVDVSAFRENVKHTLEEGLAERLDEAIRRVNGGAGEPTRPYEVH